MFGVLGFGLRVLTFHRRIKNDTSIMQLTSTVRTEAAVARLLKAVPALGPPFFWNLLAKEMNRRVVVKLGGGYQLKKKEKKDVRATTTAIDTTGVLYLVQM
jgi:hypothetical protein